MDINRFNELFGTGATPIAAFSPGRINLIGDHTDYNGGHVFPCALTIGTYGMARLRDDDKIFLYSENFGDSGVVESSLNNLKPKHRDDWTIYPESVIWSIRKKGFKVDKGMDLYFKGNIPEGAGLSSSASIEILTGFMVKELFELETLTLMDLALRAQYGENCYVGTGCGIMDQFTCALGKKDNAIFLDTHTLEYKYIPLDLKDTAVVITDSKIKHNLVSSAYNDRRKECEKGLDQLQRMIDISSLGELNNQQFERYKILISDEITQKRVKHAVTENRRTVHAVEALAEGNMEEFGRLMNKSHISLRDNYEVSCEEIDLLVHTALDIHGVIGSRMSGGGFGGCTVSLVRKRTINLFKDKLTAVYKSNYGMEPDFYTVSIGDGVHLIDISEVI
ncbi:MAG: galactokinase [Eubacterium sp.]|nr:galactokinase [Eubacterium sp.]